MNPTDKYLEEMKPAPDGFYRVICNCDNCGFSGYEQFGKGVSCKRNYEYPNCGCSTFHR